jgi:demethylmenaquinone methyltransferase / 2-methoxy-6-polyprenyl-1,4-benzoquinol methylase
VSADPQPSTSIVERYDRDAQDYGRYWGPVLDASARRLLDRVVPMVATLGGVPRILDVGTGTGVLALEALRRWPAATVFGADASSGMLGEARRRALLAGIDGEDRRLRWVHAPAETLPLPDDAVDVLVSSFTYQLVIDRSVAFHEALRVLRPGGALALVTWLDRGEDFAPAVEFDEAVYDVGIEEPEEPEEERRAGDFRSPRGAANELRRVGFRDVNARAEVLEHTWTREGYLEYKRRYDEVALFGWLDARTARRLIERARERLAALPESAFIWRADIVSVLARRR